jgi:hypothetical protein
MRCTGAPWRDATVIAYRPTAEALVVSGTDGQMLAIATPGGVSDGWRPFVQFDDAAPSIRLRRLTGAVITCNPA